MFVVIVVDAPTEIGLVVFRSDKNYLSVLLVEKDEELEYPSVEISEKDKPVKQQLITRFKEEFGIDILVISDAPLKTTGSIRKLYYTIVVSAGQELSLKLEDVKGLWFHQRYVSRVFKGTDNEDIFQQAVEWVEQDNDAVVFLANNLAKLR